MAWLRKTPIVSLLLAVALAAAPLLLAHDPGPSGPVFEDSRQEARAYLERNPRLELDLLGERILDSEWVAETGLASAATDSGLGVRLPSRWLDRSQARLDELVAKAYDARMQSDPAWHFGVLDGKSELQNYIAHVFVPGVTAGAILSIVVLLLVGIPLERTWSSPVLGAVAVGSFFAVAHAYLIFDASSGVPWHGSAGLAGALLGAYFIRGLGGHFTVPGWILLPVWLGVESFVVRGFWIDDFGSVPWATLCAAIGFGAMVAGILRVLNIEQTLDSRALSGRSWEPNLLVTRAAQLRSDDDPCQAFDLLQAAWRDEPENTEICEAFFSIAVEVGQPEAAATAILPSLRTALHQGDVQQAIDYWFPLALKKCAVELEPTAFVRLGEALLDASHPDEAFFSLRSALSAGGSSSHARRIVNIARDLDEGLARQAASMALQDPSLDPKSRGELEATASESVEEQVAQVVEELLGDVRSQFDQGVSAEHQTFEITAFPLELDPEPRVPCLEWSSLDLEADFMTPDLSEELGSGGQIDLSDLKSSGSGFDLRDLEALDAVPVAVVESGLEIEIEGRGKSHLPFSRIQAISIATVAGLGTRPVLVIDLVLNWFGGSEEPMKIIRLRGDRLDPRGLSTGKGNPLEVLTAWVVELERQSGSTCLPTRGILSGSYSKHASLVAYEREVLMASSGKE